MFANLEVVKCDGTVTNEQVRGDKRGVSEGRIEVYGIGGEMRGGGETWRSISAR